MANLGFDYNAEEHKPLENYEPLPAAHYQAMITESERVTTKAGDGELVNLVWTIIEGEYQGRKVFDRINLSNPNAQAVEIGLRQLSSICRAVGKLRITDSAELHDIPCEISVKVRPAGPDRKGVHREASNEIKGYEPLQASAPATVAVTATRTPPAANRAPAMAGVQQPAKKPWERK